jgi:hypothetical protein
MNEKRFRFTKTAVDALATPSKGDVGTVGYAMVWDTQVTGFGGQLRPSGMKTFILVYRNKAGRVRWLTIGRYARVTVDQTQGARPERSRAVSGLWCSWPDGGLSQVDKVGAVIPAPGRAVKKVGQDNILEISGDRWQNRPNV